MTSNEIIEFQIFVGINPDIKNQFDINLIIEIKLIFNHQH